MSSLSLAQIIEKNKLIGDGAWLILAEINLNNGSEFVRIVRNTENITWNEQTWIAYPFSIDLIESNVAGEIPKLTVTASNVSGVLYNMIAPYEGGVDAKITIRVVHSAHLDEGAYIEETYSVTKVVYNAREIAFSLGMDVVLGKRVPERRYLKDHCPFKYGDLNCGVSAGKIAEYPTCNKTFANCLERTNQHRYGGFPTIEMGGIYAQF